MNPWIAHVKAYQKKHGVSYKEAMSKAKSTYKAIGSSQKPKPNSVKKNDQVELARASSQTSESMPSSH